jgi:hypothetical protein
LKFLVITASFFVVTQFFGPILFEEFLVAFTLLPRLIHIFLLRLLGFAPSRLKILVLSLLYQFFSLDAKLTRFELAEEAKKLRIFEARVFILCHLCIHIIYSLVYALLFHITAHALRLVF